MPNGTWVAERFEKFSFVYLVVMSLSACIFVRADGSGHDRAAATASNRRLCAKFLPSGALKSPCHVHMTPPSCWNAQFWRKNTIFKASLKFLLRPLFYFLRGFCQANFLHLLTHPQFRGPLLPLDIR